MTEHSANQPALMRLEAVKKYFPVKSGAGANKKAQVKAVDGVSLHIRPGETFGLVGESGCGKSTLGRAVLRLFPLTEGHIYFHDQDIAALKSSELPTFRKKCQMIFQDPAGCLNPRRTVGQLLAEPLIIHKIGDAEQHRQSILAMMDRVGIGAHYFDRYAYEMSGGQKQRVGIARALLLEPQLIVCDEPVSALDASIQAQVLNLLHDLQQEFDLTYLFISHNLSVVNYVSDRVAVMYCGKIVELADKQSLYQHTAHPYTQALFAAIPLMDREIAEDAVLEGDVPSPIDPPPGCRFHPRCPWAEPRCRAEEPPLVEIGADHYAACFFPAR